MNERRSNHWLKHWDFILLDAVVMQLAYAIAFMVRQGMKNPYENPMYLTIAMTILFADLCISFFLSSYRGILRRGKQEEAISTFRHVSVVAGIVLLYLFLSKNANDYSRKIFLVFVILAYILVYIFRTLHKYIVIRYLRSTGKKNAVLLVTTEDMAQSMIEKVRKKGYNELEIVGLVLIDKNSSVGSKIDGVKIVCQKEEILDYIQTRWVDSVLINSKSDAALDKELIDKCINMGVTVHNCLADIGRNSSTQYVDRFGGYVVLSSSLRIAEEKQFLLKRLLDICGGIVGLLITGVLTIFIGPMIYIASPGPIFFAQTRIGRNGRRFKIYKFRSMYMDAEERKKELMEKNEMQGLMFKMEADPRIIGSGPDGTKHGLGWFIRKTSIDEFPQFLNVLKGDMSLVGTRPPTEDEWMKYEQHHRARMVVKPGLTGMWQVSGRNDITDFEEVVQLDMEYVERWNFFFDIKLLLKTVQVVIMGKGSK